MDKLLTKLILIEQLLTSLDLKQDSIITVQLGTIVDTQDDLQLGRVKVKLDTRGNNSTRWSYFLGYPSGQLPTEYVKVGTRVACLPAYGNANEMLILGTFGVDSLPNPLSVPVISRDDYIPMPTCNQKAVGQVHVFENMNGSDVNICVRSGKIYSWRKLYSSLITESQGYTKQELINIKNGKLPGETDSDRNLFSALPVCNESKQGQIIPFSERDEWRQFNVICSKDENGDFTWKPASTIPIFSRNNIPNPSENYHGTVIQIDDGANSYLAYCARENGTMKWMKYTGREPIKFNNTSSNIFPNNKTPKSPGAVHNPVNEAWRVTEEATQVASGIIDVATDFASEVVQALIADSTQGDPNNRLGNLTGSILNGVSNQLGVNISPKQFSTIAASSLSIAETLGVDVPSGIPTEIAKIITAKDTIPQIIRSTGNIISSYNRPDVSSVLYGVTTGGWQGALDAAVRYGLNEFPQEFKTSFASYISELGGIDTLPGPIKDIANSALGNIGIGLKDVAKYLLSGSLFDDLSKANFDLSKLDLSINPDNIGGFLKSVLGPNIDLSNLSLNAETTSKSLSAIADFAGLGDEFSSLFGSNGLGTELANALLGGIANALFKKDCEPCSCSTRKCNAFRDPVEDDRSLYEDCKIVMCGQTTYSPCNDQSKSNTNDIAKGFSALPTGFGGNINTEKPNDLTHYLVNNQPGNGVLENVETYIKCADEPDKVRERNFTNETLSKAFKTADNNITQLELTDKQIIDGLLAIIKLIFGCELDNGGLFGEINSLVGDFINVTRNLAIITNTLNSITNGGLGSDISTIIDQLGGFASSLNSVSGRLSSTACQIKADFIQPAQQTNAALEPGLPASSYTTPFSEADLETQNTPERASRERLIESVFDGVPDPRINALPNRVVTLSNYPNRDRVNEILNTVFNDPNNVPQTFNESLAPVDNEDLINNAIDNLFNNGLTPNEENGRFAGEKDCR